MMTSIGMPRLHVAKLLNHSTGDIAAIYDQHDYFQEKKAALTRWAEHLTAIIANQKPKVVPLRFSKSTPVPVEQHQSVGGS
jgi:hypothetical protein